MPEDNETPPQTGSKKPFPLSQKIGPFPGYVWAGMIGVPIAAYIVLKKKGSGATPDNSVGSAIPFQAAPGGGITTTGGGDGGGSNPVDLTPILTAIGAQTKSEADAFQQMAQSQQQASAGFMTALGNLAQSLANMRQPMTQPSTPTYTASAPSYQVPAMINPAAVSMLPPSMPIPPVYTRPPTYNPVAPYGYGVYSPYGGYTPINPAPGFERTTYFGGDGTVIYGGVPR